MDWIFSLIEWYKKPIFNPTDPLRILFIVLLVEIGVYFAWTFYRVLKEDEPRKEEEEMREDRGVPLSKVLSDEEPTHKDFSNGTEVESSNIKFVGYDRDRKVLIVGFKPKGVYEYKDVEPVVFKKILKIGKAGNSVGKFFHQNVKNKYDAKKIK